MLGNQGCRDTLMSMQYLLLYHGYNGYANAPQFYACTYISCLVDEILF